MNSAGKSMLVCALLSGVLGGFAEETQWKQFPIWGGGYVQNVEISKSSPNVWYTYVDVCGPYRSTDGMAPDALSTWAATSRAPHSKFSNSAE